MSLVFNFERLDEVFRSYHAVANCRVAIYDDEGREVISYPRELCGLCKVLRSYPEVDRRCIADDRAAFRRVRQSGAIEIYECSMGLHEAVAPIKQEGDIIGFVMIGQMVNRSNRETVFTRCRPYFRNRDELAEAVAAAELLDREKLRAGAVLMSVCAEYLCLTNDLTRQKQHIYMVICDYIAANLQGALTVEHLSARFALSRTALFQLFNSMSGRPVAETIRELRLKKSRELLVKTSLSVSQIAEAVGIPDSNYFGRLFKRHQGITPLQYRREHAGYHR